MLKSSPRIYLLSQIKPHFTSLHFSSVTQSCLTLCDPMNLSTPVSLSITNSRSLLKLKSIESVMPSSHLILGHHLFLLPPIPPSIRVFSKESTLHMRWPKYWSFGFSIIPSKEIPGLISFRMDWLDLLAVQGTLKSLAIIKKSTNNKCWTVCGEKGTLLHCWWECKLQPL